MSEITKPLLLNETVQALNSKIDTTNGYLQRIAAGVAPNLITKTITENGTYIASDDNADGYSSVTVQEGSPTGYVQGVTFYDYDGTVLHTYTKDQFLALTEMPANPTHTGLTSQGWNWSLEDAKAYVSDYDGLQIGQSYITDDGKTRIYIHLEEGRLKPTLNIGLNGTCVIDWGDGSATDTLTGTSLSTTYSQEHTYSTGGDYVISLNVTGSFAFLGDSSNGGKLLSKSSFFSSNWSKVYLNTVNKIEIGDSVTSIGNTAFQNCYSLTSITIPEGVTSIGSGAFNSCYSLTSITIPEGVTSIGGSTFQSCYSLTSITIPDGVTSIGSGAFQSCSSLTSITIPDSVTLIDSGAFQSCSSLTSITIPEGVTSIGGSTFQSCSSLTSITIPEGVTSIGNTAFQSCYSLTSITIPEGVTSIGNNAFYNCYSLTSITIPEGVTSIGGGAFNSCSSLTSITIPEGVTSIGGSTFQNCYSLTSITIPEGVTSIGNTAFQNCYSLTSITIPDSVTSIGNNAFNSCYGLGFIKFESSTPPTASASSAFGSVPTDCIIYVPTGSLSDYTTATNYPNPNTYTYVEY